jgi:glutaredoxin 3
MFYIYSRPGCGYCQAAKELLTQKGQAFTELTLDSGQPKQAGVTYYTKAQLLEKAPLAKTVPQIFHNQTYIGGYTDLRNYLQK